jgi:hypothetical protein
VRGARQCHSLVFSASLRVHISSINSISPFGQESNEEERARAEGNGGCVVGGKHIVVDEADGMVQVLRSLYCEHVHTCTLLSFTDRCCEAWETCRITKTMLCRHAQR